MTAIYLVAPTVERERLHELTVERVHEMTVERERLHELES